MNQQEASRVVGFLATAKPNTEAMKGHIVNSINALLLSADPVSVRFSQIFTEAINRASSNVLNESANPMLPPQAMQPFNSRPQQPQQPQYQQPIQQHQNSPSEILEAIHNRAALLV